MRLYCLMASVLIGACAAPAITTQTSMYHPEPRPGQIFDPMPVPAPLPRTYVAEAPSLDATPPHSARDCRQVCNAENRIKDETVEHCLLRVHYWLFALERHFFEHQKYRRGTQAALCLSVHQDVMVAHDITPPNYECQRLEMVRTLPVDPTVWKEECGEDPTAWWCEIDLSRNHYAFVIPVFKGSKCPTLSPPLRSAY